MKKLTGDGRGGRRGGGKRRKESRRKKRKGINQVSIDGSIIIIIDRNSFGREKSEITKSAATTTRYFLFLSPPPSSPPSPPRKQPENDASPFLETVTKFDLLQTIAANLETIDRDRVESARVRRHLQVSSIEAGADLSDPSGRQTGGQVSQGRLPSS